MKARELNNIGFPKGDLTRLALRCIGDAARNGPKLNRPELRQKLSDLLEAPEDWIDDPHFAGLARALVDGEGIGPEFIEREEPAPYRQWGEDLDPNALQQMQHACRLPVATQAALMPDAHLGYGLPIGGVLAVENAVIPYAVGVDIACRMKLTVLDLRTETIDRDTGKLKQALQRETRFGIGASFEKKTRREHDVLDADWNISPVTKHFKPKAWSQLGTSGSGNHFVEFGILTLTDADLGLEAGEWLALLSHSGSRGTGAAVANHYSKLAMAEHPELPKELRHLAWLDLGSEAGQEYWAAMNLMGEYAAANHAVIHRSIAKNLGVKVLLDVENHHNFAWKETHGGKEVIVHRKGATPAGKGVLGVIPGSMGAPGFVVRGKGQPDSLASASHGAGRMMSRTQAKKSFRWKEVKQFLRTRKVELISAGLDEVPMAYKDIEKVMASQRDLVDIVARFDPRIVKMAPAGEPPED